MRSNYLLMLVIVLLFAVQAFGATIIHQTDITGPTTWPKSGNPYTITGLVSVDSGATLTIEAGVDISFDQDTVTNIAGIVVFPGAVMYANGEESDSIYFRGDGRQRNGFVTAYDYVRLNYCRFENMNGSYFGEYAGALELNAKDSSHVDHSMFWRNASPLRNGGAICISITTLSQISARATIKNCYFYGNNTARGSGGAIMYGPYSYGDIIGCTFDSNYVTDFARPGGGGFGGAISISGALGGSIVNNVFTNNYAYFGGAIFKENISQTSVIIKGNLFYHNNAKIGGAAYLWNPAIFTNNTIVENSADSCGGVCFWQPHPQDNNTNNNILWNNTALLNTQADEYFLDVSAFSCIEGYSNPAKSVIDSDPLFASPLTHNYHLTLNSPCINAGDTLSPLDPDYTRADMGAFYYRLSNGSGDANNNCIISGSDVTFLIRFLKGIGIEPPIRWKADANGSCSVSGSDVTFLINYFKGKNTCPTKNTTCEWTPPAPPDPCNW